MSLDHLTGAELHRKDITPCGLCGKGVMHTGLPMCWRLSIERVGFDARAIERAHGLELVVGSPLLAAVMGPDDPLGKAFQAPIVVLVCEKCINEAYLPARIQEIASAREQESEATE